jgi:hypothetical protein
MSSTRVPGRSRRVLVRLIAGLVLIAGGAVRLVTGHGQGFAYVALAAGIVLVVVAGFAYRSSRRSGRRPE